MHNLLFRQPVDHDFTKSSIIPSVVLIKKKSPISWYGPGVHYKGCRNSAKNGQILCHTHAGSANAPLFLVSPSVAQLEDLQAQNQLLMSENRRFNQLEADLLRFEKESQKAWDD